MDTPIENQIAGLPSARQLEIAEFIYESLLERGELLTAAQMAETRRRSKQAENEPESLLTAEQLWQEVDRLKNARNS